MRAYLEVSYLNNKTASAYEEQFKNLPRVARPQLKDIKKRADKNPEKKL